MNFGPASASCGTVFDLPGKLSQIQSLEKKMSAAGFWNNPDAANELIRRLKQLKSAVEPFQALEGRFEDAEVTYQLIVEEGGEADLEAQLEQSLRELQEEFDQVELSTLLNGQNDNSNAILSIHPGAGGTESCDWAGMLLRMYTRWCERKGFRAELIDLLPGEEAGVKSATLSISGEYAFGYLKSESGVHRLVRISPFDSNSRRHTSFVAVEVIPETDDTIEIEIAEKDLRIDTYRASGAGGQHVNKTSSAVRITHIPTGIVVQCQNERSQHKNRSMAMKVLSARMLAKAREEKEAELARERDEKHMDVAWGSQIRSYVLHPYQMIKDHRTGVEIGNVQSILDGGIDPLVEAYLKWRAMGN